MKNFPGAEAYVLIGLKKPALNGSYPPETTWADVWHKVGFYNGLFYDYSARQFDRDAKIPEVYTKEEIEEKWHYVMTEEVFMHYEDADMTLEDFFGLSSFDIDTIDVPEPL